MYIFYFCFELELDLKQHEIYTVKEHFCARKINTSVTISSWVSVKRPSNNLVQGPVSRKPR